MATAEELLSAALGTDDAVLTIDSNLRTIKIPQSVKNLGVESDGNVLYLNFQMPRYYGDIDLSEFSIYINYINAKEEGDVYEVYNTVVGEDAITFTWLVGRHAAMYAGSVNFIVCLKKFNVDNEVIKEFNTTIASLPILKGLETSEAVIEQNVDLLKQWEQKLFEDLGKIDEATAAIIAIQNSYIGGDGS